MLQDAFKKGAADALARFKLGAAPGAVAPNTAVPAMAMAAPHAPAALPGPPSPAAAPVAPKVKTVL